MKSSTKRLFKYAALFGLATVALLGSASPANARVEVLFNGTTATIRGDEADNNLMAVRDPASTIPGYAPAIWLHNAQAPNDIYAVGQSAARCGWQSNGYGFSCIGLTRVTITGGAGNDTIVADSLPGVTQIKGGTGKDTITGTDKQDKIDGGPGDDVIGARGGDDAVNDIAGGNDTILGGAGSDKIKARYGADTVFGGTFGGDVPGRDIVKVADRSPDDEVRAGRPGCLRGGFDAGDSVFGAGQASDSFCLGVLTN